MTYMRKNLHFCNLKKNALRTDGPTDGPTDGRTDRPSYRDARTHLKMDVTAVAVKTMTDCNIVIFR